MKTNLQKGKTKRPKPILLSQPRKSNNLPKFYTVMVSLLSPNYSVLNDYHITDVAEHLVVLSHLRMDYHKKVRVLVRSVRMRLVSLSH